MADCCSRVLIKTIVTTASMYAYIAEEEMDVDGIDPDDDRSEKAAHTAISDVPWACKTAIAIHTMALRM
jgi:hypothetical protein